MKLQDRIIFSALLATAAGAGIAYARGRRGMELVSVETLGYSALAFVGGNVVWELARGTEDSVPIALANTPLGNWVNSGMGNMSKDAVKLLSEIDPEKLFSTMKKNGITVDLVPENPFAISQDKS